MKQFFICFAVFMGMMGVVMASTQDVEMPNMATIELISIETARVLNNPDMNDPDRPYVHFAPQEKLIKVNFKSSIDLLDVARTQNREVGYVGTTLCNTKVQYKEGEGKEYSIIPDYSELYQYGVNFEYQTKANLLKEHPNSSWDMTHVSELINRYFMINKKRMQRYYFYIGVHSVDASPDNSYNLEKTPEDICFRLGADRLGSVGGIPTETDPIYSNTIRIPKEAITEALKHD